MPNGSRGASGGCASAWSGSFSRTASTPRSRARCGRPFGRSKVSARRAWRSRCRTRPWRCPTYYIIAPAEASSNLARYAGVLYGHRTAHADDLLTLYARTRQEGFGAEVKRRIMLGTYALSAGYYDAFYVRAQRVRALVRREYEDALRTADVIVGPVAPTTAFPLGERVEDPLQMYLADVFTVPLNLAGLPGISVPCGFAGGLPVGLQIAGRAFDEATVLDVAYALEQATEFHRARPPLAGSAGGSPRA